jgi:hypothetical protein
MVSEENSFNIKITSDRQCLTLSEVKQYDNGILSRVTNQTDRVYTTIRMH